VSRVKPAVSLPKLMLAADMPRVMRCIAAIDPMADSTVVIDAEELEFAEPLPLCLLASQLANLQRLGGRASIEKLRKPVADRLERMNVLRDWIEARPASKSPLHNFAALQVAQASCIDDGNEIANSLAQRIAQFVPAEFCHQSSMMTRDGIVHPLGYMLTELLENSLTHGRGKGFGHASAWIAAQYYSSGDRIRLAIVDNGCGFLKSLQEHAAVQPKNHATAIRAAFLPGVSCNRSVGLVRDSLNAGLGLTVSRDIAIRSGGTVWAGSGEIWLQQPGREDESVKRIQAWQGSMLNFEIHRAGLISFNFRELFARYPHPGEVPSISFTD
jgi:signal transduction histidine kinase